MGGLLWVRGSAANRGARRGNRVPWGIGRRTGPGRILAIPLGAAAHPSSPRVVAAGPSPRVCAVFMRVARAFHEEPTRPRGPPCSAALLGLGASRIWAAPSLPAPSGSEADLASLCASEAAWDRSRPPTPPYPDRRRRPRRGSRCAGSRPGAAPGEGRPDPHPGAALALVGRPPPRRRRRAQPSDGDDFAARVYVMFRFEEEEASLFRRIRQRVGARLYGQEMPGTALSLRLVEPRATGGAAGSTPSPTSRSTVALATGPAEGWREEAVDLVAEPTARQLRPRTAPGALGARHDDRRRRPPVGSAVARYAGFQLTAGPP